MQAISPAAATRSPSGLVVGDEPPIAEVVSRCLERAGYGPEITTDLVAQIDAFIRRVEPSPEPSRALVFDGLELDPVARRLYVHGIEIRLTQREFELLLFLARHPGRVFDRDELIRAVWQYSFYTDTSTVTVHVRRLRAKIEADPANPRHLQTVWGVGYRFDP
jgi:two-component system response regulator ResD